MRHAYGSRDAVGAVVAVPDLSVERGPIFSRVSSDAYVSRDPAGAVVGAGLSVDGGPWDVAAGTVVVFLSAG